MSTLRSLALVVVLSLLVVACGGGAQTQGAPADGGTAQDAGADTAADGGGDAIADLEAQLSENLYYIASQESGTDTNSCTPVEEGEDISIAFSIEGLSHPFLVTQQRLAQETGERLGAEVRVFSAEDDVNRQFSDVEAALAQGTDALLMMPANTEGLASILTQYDAQDTPYFFTQKGMTGSNPKSQVLAAYADEGRILGEFVAEHYAGEDNVNVAIIEGIAGDVSSVARVGAFTIELLQAGNFTIVAQQPGEYRREPSQEVMESFLAAHPDLDLVFGANDEAGLGALAAIRGAGVDTVDVVSIDGQSDVWPEIESGAILATVTHTPTAGLAVEQAVNCLRGEEVPAYLVDPGVLVTADNLDEVEPAF